MDRKAALALANAALTKYIEHQSMPNLTAATAEEVGHRVGEFIGGLHAQLVTYFEKVKD